MGLQVISHISRVITLIFGHLYRLIFTPFITIGSGAHLAVWIGRTFGSENTFCDQNSGSSCCLHPQILNGWAIWLHFYDLQDSDVRPDTGGPAGHEPGIHISKSLHCFPCSIPTFLRFFPRHSIEENDESNGHLLLKVADHDKHSSQKCWKKPPLVHAQKKQSPNWRPPVALSTPLGCPKKWMDQWWTDQWVSYNLLIDGVFHGGKKTTDPINFDPIHLDVPGHPDAKTPRWGKFPSDQGEHLSLFGPSIHS